MFKYVFASAVAAGSVLCLPGLAGADDSVSEVDDDPSLARSCTATVNNQYSVHPGTVVNIMVDDVVVTTMTGVEDSGDLVTVSDAFEISSSKTPTFTAIPGPSGVTSLSDVEFSCVAIVPEVVEPPVTEPPVTEPPVTEPPVTEPPVTEPPVTEPPVTEPPVTKAPNPVVVSAPTTALSAPTAVAAAGAGMAEDDCSTGASDNCLALTGTNSTILGLVGSGLTLIGGALVALRKKSVLGV